MRVIIGRSESPARAPARTLRPAGSLATFLAANLEADRRQVVDLPRDEDHGDPPRENHRHKSSQADRTDGCRPPQLKAPEPAQPLGTGCALVRWGTTTRYSSAFMLDDGSNMRWAQSVPSP